LLKQASAVITMATHLIESVGNNIRLRTNTIKGLPFTRFELKTQRSSHTYANITYAFETARLLTEVIG
ncbi:MAG: hypothetical protein VW865_12590, partial [Halieaceae bacterium]